MQIEWYGQSAFRLTDGATTVFIDPFGDMTAMLDRGMRWDYPAIEGVKADVLLVTHEHLDHNGVEAVGGDPVTVRSTAGRLESPIGQVLGITSEHDEVAGTERGANTLFLFTLAGQRVAHLGDLGQRVLRDEQLTALGTVDLLFVPVGGGPTIGAEQASEIGAAVGASFIVPHYKTKRIDFLEPVDKFAERAARAARRAVKTKADVSLARSTAAQKTMTVAGVPASPAHTAGGPRDRERTRIRPRFCFDRSACSDAASTWVSRALSRRDAAVSAATVRQSAAVPQSRDCVGLARPGDDETMSRRCRPQGLSQQGWSLVACGALS